MTGYDLARTFHASVDTLLERAELDDPSCTAWSTTKLIAGEDVTRVCGNQAAVFDHGCRNRSLSGAWMTQPLDDAPERDPALPEGRLFRVERHVHLAEQLRRHAELYREPGADSGWGSCARARPGASAGAAAVGDLRRQDDDRIVAFKVFAYEGLVAQADQEIAWAERGLALIDSLADHQRSV